MHFISLIFRNASYKIADNNNNGRLAGLEKLHPARCNLSRRVASTECDWPDKSGSTGRFRSATAVASLTSLPLLYPVVETPLSRRKSWSFLTVNLSKDKVVDIIYKIQRLNTQSRSKSENIGEIRAECSGNQRRSNRKRTNPKWRYVESLTNLDTVAMYDVTAERALLHQPWVIGTLWEPSCCTIKGHLRSTLRLLVLVNLFQIAPAGTVQLQLQPNLGHMCSVGTFMLWYY